MAESWVRLWAGTTTDPKWQTIARKSGQPRYLVIALFTHMLMVANESDQRGSVASMSIEDAASALDCEEEQIYDILHAMEDRVVEPGGMLSGWARRQPSREDSGNPETGAKSSTERVREYRQRNKESGQMKRDETQCNEMKRDETQCNAPEADTEADTENPRVKAHASGSSPGGTPAGAVCARLKSECQIVDVSPSHPKLLALLGAGLTDNEIVAAGHEAKAKGKGFAYALAVAEGRRRDAANVKPLPDKAATGGLTQAGQKTAAAVSRWLESEGVQE